MADLPGQRLQLVTQRLDSLSQVAFDPDRFDQTPQRGVQFGCRFLRGVYAFFELLLAVNDYGRAAAALIACQRGLATRGGAAGVGRATTRAVVAMIIAVIVLDAVFAFFTNVFDL